MKLVMAKHIRYLLLGSLLAVAVLLVQLPRLASAGSAYGRGGYGSCGYTQCAPSTTVITVPPNLDVAINLRDGQTIPDGTYALVATPLNGVGSSFDHIDFYVDDQLLATVKPDETGTASWVWNTHDNPGNMVKVVVTGTNGQTVTKTFHVHVDTPKRLSLAGATAANTSSSSVQSIVHAATRVVAALPAPLIRTFPYILFLVLLGNFVLLVTQLRKEAEEHELTQRLLTRQRDVTSAKHVLLQLLSHYLRTPLTVINGGIDMLAEDIPANWRQLRQSLHENVELLISQVRTEASAVDALSAVEQPATESQFWRRPGLLVPIVLIGLVATAFDYLAHSASRSNVTQASVAGQILVFFSLAILTYVVFRLLQLRRQDARKTNRVMDAEASLVQARDDLLAEGVGLLGRTVKQIDVQSAALPAGQAKEFMREGCERLGELLQRFQLAASVRGAHVDKPFTAVAWRELLERASAPLVEPAAKRHVQLPAGSDQIVAVRDVDLLVRVLGSVLDNAVAYSQDGGRIEADCRVEKGLTLLTITDHGAGIPADKLATLFAPFQKLEGVETFDHEGMGFNLYLDRLIMTYLGGSIRATSPRGGGTQMTLVLPNA